MNNKAFLPDYSTFLDKPGMLDYIESEWLKNPQLHEKQAAIINSVVEEKNIRSFIEIGCSTGNTAKRIVHPGYCGFDANLTSLCLAMMKNPGKKFIHGDIRDVDKYLIDHSDLVFSFAVLKHFALLEWPEIFQKILSCGIYAVFDIPIDAKGNYDDGTEHHHVWLTKDYINEQIALAGHKLLSTFEANTLEPIFLTRKIVSNL